METTKDLFKHLEEAENLFSTGKIKNAQKILKSVIKISRDMNKIPNKLKHKINFAIGQSRYYDDMSSFAANPKREQLINDVKKLISKPNEKPRKQAHNINSIQTKWQLLDLTSKPASRDQWNKFKELTNKAWVPCKEYFDEIKEIKVQNAKKREMIIDEINNYTNECSNKWPSTKELILFLKNTYEKWQKYAPVLDKDINNLQKSYYEAKRPINEHIKKDEIKVIKLKESLISQVTEINSDNNDLNIKKFNDIKNHWKKIGSAGRKNDKKLWDKFNEAGDKFFKVKKDAVKNEINLLKDLHNKFNNGDIDINNIEKELTQFVKLNKLKEYKNLINDISTKKSKVIADSKNQKIQNYISILKNLENNKNISDFPKSIENAIKNCKNNAKSNYDELLRICIRLEMMAGLDSPKKDLETKKLIQLDMLKNKFNKGENKESIELLIVDFLNNYSLKEANKSDKNLWKRIEKTIPIIIS